MANKKHVALLKKGKAAWNRWRDRNANIKANLREANLILADLSGANLSKADLRTLPTRTKASAEIKVCDRWRFGEGGKSGFECFLEDMGPMPDESNGG